MSDEACTSDSTAYLVEEKWLPYKKYVDILKNVDTTCCIEIPPVKPLPGEIYVFHNPEKPEDWKADQCQWLCWGLKKIPQSNPLLLCHYYVSKSSTNFKKRAYLLYEPDKCYGPITLIHYVGSLKDVEQVPHGNRKLDAKPHVRTAKSQLCEQKVRASDHPKFVYRQLSGVHAQPTSMPVMLPRDSKQVKNTIHNERQKRLISQDDMHALYLLGHEVTCYVKRLELVPQVLCVLFSNQMKEEFNRIRDIKNWALFYDTTFNLGDSYVSPLVMSHKAFRQSPAIPLAYNIHDTKQVRPHEEFFKFLCSQSWNFENKVIVTDREAAIRRGIRSALPGTPSFVCWNHIQRDVRHWVSKQQNADKGDESIYTTHIWDLLDSDSESVLLNKLDGMSTQWSSEFLSYFNGYIRKDVMENAKWVLQLHDMYTEGSGVTSNVSESVNSLLKRIQEKQEVLLQKLVLSCYNLDLYYINEIMRGFCGLGDYSLLPEYSKFQLKLHEANFPSKAVDLDEQPAIWQDKFRFPSHAQQEPHIPHSTDNLAKQLLLGGRITHVPDQGIFIVEGTSGQKHMVQLFDRTKGFVQTCTCRAQKGCHHVHAVLLSIGIVKDTKAYRKIHVIHAKNRGFRSGRKRLNPKFAVVEASDDSMCIQDETDLGNTVLYPVSVGEKKMVKRRFSTLKPVDNTTTDVSFKSVVTSTPSKMKKPLISASKEKGSKVNFVNSLTCKSVEEKVVENPASGIMCHSPQRDVPKLVIDDEAPDVGETFQNKFDRNGQFVIFGRMCYPSDLNCLLKKRKNTLANEYYLSDSLLECYLAILCHERSESFDSVLVFPTPCLFNYVGSETAASDAICSFIREDIPEHDIILIPIVRNSHCSLIVVLKKTKRIVYLDSNGGYDKHAVHFLLHAWKGYCMYHRIPFNENEWTVWVVHDIPQQPNAYDCGVYVCLYAEIITSQSLDSINSYHDPVDPVICSEKMFHYRDLIHEKMLHYMERGIPAPKSRSFDVEKVRALQVGEISNLRRLTPVNIELKQSTPLIFLSSLVRNHWDETSLVCHLGSSCKQLKDDQVMCTACSHWFHLYCIALSPKHLPDKYICKKCLGVREISQGEDGKRKRTIKVNKQEDYAY